MSEPLNLRDQTIPTNLIVIRLGVQTLSDERLTNGAYRCHERWGIWGFSVLEVPDGDDFVRLGRLRPELSERRHFLRADGLSLAKDGFPLLATMDFPHWTVVLGALDVALFDRLRSHFSEPIENPVWRR